MGNFTIPNRPLPGDTRHVADIEADFDYLSGNMDSMASKRSLLGQACIYVGVNTVNPQLILVTGVGVASGGNSSTPPVMWRADAAGEFAISNKSSVCRLRATVASMGTNHSITAGITALTLSGGTAGNIQYTWTTPGAVLLSATTFTAGTLTSAESTEQALPTDGNVYGFYVSGATGASDYYAACLQLYCYNT